MEGIQVRPLGFLGFAPSEGEVAGEVAAVQPVPRVQVVADLRGGGDTNCLSLGLPYYLKI